MFRVYLTLVFALILISQAFSQTPEKKDSNVDDDIVKISTNLIQLDVTVTDKNGKIVSDLKSEDFEIFENNKKQNITNFSFISANEPGPRAKKSKNKNSISVPIPPPKIRRSQAKRTIALVVDDLTLSFASTFWVKKALKKFVDEQMQQGDLVAIIRTGDGIGALQQFTTDKRQLYAAIRKVKFNLKGAGRISTFNPISPSLNEQLDGTMDRDGKVRDLSKEIDRDRDAARDRENFRQSVYASGTLGAINFIVRGMKDLPGRKSIMLLSDGIPLFQRESDDRPVYNSAISSRMHRLIDLANRASVVIYSIDARGLVYDGPSAADNVYGLSGGRINRKLAERSSYLFDSQSGMKYLASQTGGFAIINSNNINKGIRRVLNDQSYYLLGYQPEEETFDPETRRFNKISIKVKRKNTKVRYRSGFFGISEEEIKKPVVETPIQKMLNAITSPFAVNEITMSMNNIFVSDENQKLYIQSYLHIDAKDLSFKKESENKYKVVFDLAALVFGNNGKIVSESTKNYTLITSSENYEKIMKKGFVYNYTIPFEKSGGYQVRLALRDVETNKVGSANQFVEVPNIKKRRLTLSGIILERMSVKQWLQISKDAATYQTIRKNTTPQIDTARRHFSRGSILRAGVGIYNAKGSARRKPDLNARLRIIRDGKIYYESEDTPINPSLSASFRDINKTFVITLGEKMQLGDYILQIIVTDKLAKRKRQVATQFVQFEIVE